MSLAACNSGVKNKEAVRQGVIDHLVKNGFNMQVMDVNLTSADIQGSQADATVSIVLKGNPAQGLSRRYRLELKGSQWQVTGSQDASGSPHGGGALPPAMPGTANPHGAMPPSAPPQGSGKMPSPEDLPPSGKKK